MHTLLEVVRQSGPCSLEPDRLAQISRLENFVQQQFPSIEAQLATELVYRWVQASREYIGEWTSVLTAAGGRVSAEPLIAIAAPWESELAVSSTGVGFSLNFPQLFKEYQTQEPKAVDTVEAIVASWAAACRKGLFQSGRRAISLPELFALFLTVCSLTEETDNGLDPLSKECAAYDTLAAPLRELNGLERSALRSMRNEVSPSADEEVMDQYLLSVCASQLIRPFSESALERALRDLSDKLRAMPYVGMLLAMDDARAIDVEHLKEDQSLSKAASKRLALRGDWIRDRIRQGMGA